VDQGVLVDGGHALIDLLDADGTPPRAVVWIINNEADTRKLWVVPHKSVTDLREFYRRISTLVSAKRSAVHGLEASDVEMIKEDHPAITGLKFVARAPGKQVIQLTRGKFNGFFLPDSIILRMNL